MQVHGTGITVSAGQLIGFGANINALRDDEACCGRPFLAIHQFERHLVG